MKKGALKVLSAVLSTAMMSTVLVVPSVKAAEMPTPVVSYNFSSAPAGLTLAGEAKVEDGVLKLATTESNNVTYAKFADNIFKGADFSNGLTLTAKINVTGYVSDWTPVFMFGSGTLGCAGECDATLQLTQGWSSRISSNGLFDGYFGNLIAEPYTWDYFNTEDNRNKWLTLTMTVTPDVMFTYIDGVQVQTANAGNQDSDVVFKEFLSKFNTMTGNYLGGSYWTADADFQGSLDNVAVYNTALTQEQVASLETAFTADVEPDITTPETPDTTTPENTDTVTDGAIDATPETPDTTTPDTTTPETPDTTTPETPDTTTPEDTTPAPAEDEKPAAAAKLNKKKATVKVGKSVKLKVQNTTKKVTWSSSNKKVAKVNKSGKVTGVKAGKAVIKAKVGGKTLKCNVTVK